MPDAPTGPEAQEVRHRPRRSPPWWPEDEPWPPRGRPDRRHWQGMRRSFFRRAGCFFGLLLFMLAGLITLFFWVVAQAFGLVQFTPGELSTLRIVSIALLLLALLGISLVAVAIRRTAAPIGKILDAVGKVTEGDYSVRIAERRPGEAMGLTDAFNQMASRLHATDQERRKMLADVTHELRTPITVIQGNLEGMLDGIYTADSEHLTATLEETRVLSRVIDDLRTLSLAESGAIQLEYDQVDPPDLLDGLLAAFQPQAQAAGIHLAVDHTPDLPPIEMDPVRIREVLSNLLANALRYTPPGGQITLRAWQDPEGRTHFSVIDTGSGISSSDLPHIFDRFYKTSDSHGTGLGLAIAKNLVAAHHGEIAARSQPGQGTEIEFWLPPT